jgi:hypothetical protein
MLLPFLLKKKVSKPKSSPIGFRNSISAISNTKKIPLEKEEVTTYRLQRFWPKSPGEEAARGITKKMKKWISGSVLQQQLYAAFGKDERLKEK